MASHLKVEGIYDQRTLKLLKSKSIKNFGFDFSPKSFNFIQEHIFLEELIPLLDGQDNIHLHFTRSNDPMIERVVENLRKNGVDKKNIFLECDEWSVQPFEIGINYYVNYSPENSPSLCKGELFQGIIFQFLFLEELHYKNLLNNFISNFYTQYSHFLTEDKKIILKTDWSHNIFPSLLEYFEFDLLAFSINSKIEICYRNVDLKKLNSEMVFFEKNNFSANKI